MRTRREDVAPTTRAECEAEISKAHATYVLACECGDEEIACREQEHVNALIEQWQSSPQQRRP